MGEEKDIVKIRKGSSTDEDAEELREVLSVLRSEVPSLIRSLMEPLKELMDLTYNPERARERAKAIASFYKELVDQGIPEDLALKITKEHFINPMSVIKSVMKGEED